MKPTPFWLLTVFSGGFCRIKRLSTAVEAYDQTIYEDSVATRMAAGDGLFGTYPLTDANQCTAFDAWRRAQLAACPLASQPDA